MKDRPVAPSDIQGPRKLICHHCGAVNTPKAYCCTTCFKILRPKAKTTLWQLAMRPSVSIILVLVLALLGGLLAMKRWIGAVEARVQMDLKSADYHISVVADKKRQGLSGGESDDASIADEPAGAEPAPMETAPAGIPAEPQPE